VTMQLGLWEASKKIAPRVVAVFLHSAPRGGRDETIRKMAPP
jgi:hypothetical protein